MSRDRDDDEPIDLDRERRVRAKLDRLADLLRHEPDLASRTHAVLAGELEAPDLESEVSEHEKETAVRLPEELVRRADALIQPLREHPELQRWGRTSRASVVRLALSRGLADLEVEIGRDVRLTLTRETDDAGVEVWSWVLDGPFVVRQGGCERPEVAVQFVLGALRHFGLGPARALRVLTEALGAMGDSPTP